MSLSIMQPYVFPYIGYFQLIRAADYFVFYDDVNFIKQGWVNRNRILINGKAHTFSIPVKKISSFNAINQTEISYDPLPRKQIRKLLTSIKSSYVKAPYFESVFPLVHDLLHAPFAVISEMAIESVVRVMEYIGEPMKYSLSSNLSIQSEDRVERIIQICDYYKAKTYINSIGGMELYDKDTFREYDIDLLFLKCNEINYSQFRSPFVPHLSIIDVLMFNSPKETLQLLNEFTLI